MKYVCIFSTCFLLLISFFGWGFIAGEYKIFPYPQINHVRKEIIAFYRGGRANKKTIAKKLINDIGFRPERLLVPLTTHRVRRYNSLEIPGLKKRRLKPLIYMGEKGAMPPGYLFIWGAFDFLEHVHGGILLDHNGNFIHKWIPDEHAFANEVRAYNEVMSKNIRYIPPEGRFPHGVVIFPDGSLIFNDGDPGNGMEKIDFCSNVLWVKLGKYNHTITKQPNDSSIWCIDGDNALHQIDTNMGESLKLIDMRDVIQQNPSIDVLGLRCDYINGKWLSNRWHINDVEPLPPRYEDMFPQFKPEDLLLSLRSLNLLMVIDQNSRKIKWWKVGITRRQHDPDWQPDGTISIYDNQMSNRLTGTQTSFSRIVNIDPQNSLVKVLYDGQNDNFYSNIRGKHQILPNGNILITSSMQGRVLVVNRNGKTLCEILNRYDEKQALLISEAIWVPEGFFDFNIKSERCKRAKKTIWMPGNKVSIHYSKSKLILQRKIKNRKEIPFEKKIYFYDNPYIAFDGWSMPESSFRWTEGHSALLYFRLPKRASEKGVTIFMRLHTLGRQRFGVFINNEFIRKYDINLSHPKTLGLRVSPDKIKKSDITILRFELPDARTPHSLDSRVLAIALYDIKFCLHHN